MWKVWLGKNDVRTNPRLIARWGKKSSMGFIDEVQYFIYAGDYGGAFDCELRNTDKGIPQIGHMTQVRKTQQKKSNSLKIKLCFKSGSTSCLVSYLVSSYCDCN